MMGRYFRILIAATSLQLCSAAFAQPASSGVVASLPFVSPIFGDNMVLQRSKLNIIWGWSDPGDTVRVQLGGQSATGITAADRGWQVRILPPAPGGPYTLRIAGRQTVELHNVLVGDVWLCGGQSNMGLPLRFARNGPEEVKAAQDPEIRFFTVMGHAAYHSAAVAEGSWRVVSPETADWVSAVGYYFARRIRQEIRVPIGLVIDAVGGSPAEAWTSAAALRTLKDFNVPLAELERLTAEGAPEYGNYVMHWYDEYDIGLKQQWSGSDLDESTWSSVQIPGGFSELGVPDTPAVAWFRKALVLPDPLPPGGATIFLGAIERMDTVYLNGVSVGGSAWVENPRVYPLRPGILKPGRNLIAIRVLKTQIDGGFLGKADQLRLVLGDQSTISLAGAWKGKLSVDARPPHPLPIAYENWPVMPSVLYNGMLAPVAPLSIAGAICYQGEQNSDRGYQYRNVLPAMIADWRRTFGQADFPFYIVSLPAFRPHSAVPVEDAWAETRESQALTAATVPNSCLAVTIDTGDPDNIHAKDKQPVGERLALCALAKYYGRHVVYQGPALAKVDRLPGSIRLHFRHTEGGLIVKGEKLAEFSIAGEDRKWYWADAHVEGDTVVVSSPLVPDPKEVRYAWQSNPTATLFNRPGLPAVPFRTDTWPASTEKQRTY